MPAIRTAESATANESLMEAHHEITPLSLSADAVCLGQLRRHRAGAAGYDNDDGDTRSHDHRADDHGTDRDERSLRYPGTASREGGISNGFAGPELCLDARLLALERHELGLGSRQLDRQAASSRGLCRRPLGPPRQSLGLGGRLLALVIASNLRAVGTPLCRRQEASPRNPRSNGYRA